MNSLDISGIGTEFKNAFKSAINDNFNYIDGEVCPDVTVIIKYDGVFSIQPVLITRKIHIAVPDSLDSLKMIHNDVLMASFLAFQMTNTIQDTSLMGIHGNTHYLKGSRTGIVISAIDKVKGKTVLSLSLNDIGLPFLSDEYTIFDLSSPALYIPRNNFLTVRQDFLDHERQSVIKLLTPFSSLGELNFFKLENELLGDKNQFVEVDRLLLFFLGNCTRIEVMDKEELTQKILSQVYHYFYKFGLTNRDMYEKRLQVEEKVRRLTKYSEGYLLPLEDSFQSTRNRDFIKGALNGKL